MSLLELDGVSKRFTGPAETVQAVRGVSLSIEGGEVVVLHGPSGSGKSTLLLLAAGALAPDSGTVRFDGRSLAGMAPGELSVHLRERVGVAYQDPQLLAGHTALANVAIKLLSGSLSLGEAQRVALPWLARVGLSDRLDHRPGRLSGGERRRVALARAMVGGPALLLLDEPTANLDSRRGSEILDLIAAAAGDGAAVLLVTHDDAAGRIASRTHELRDGVMADALSERAA
jgi:putative ABC transport system ATP-binding protein